MRSALAARSAERLLLRPWCPLQVCNEVPYTTYQTKCNTITQTRSVCDIVYQQQCNKVRGGSSSCCMSAIALTTAPALWHGE